MRFSDYTKTLGSCDIIISHKFLLLCYTEDYIINQDSELLTICYMSYKCITSPIVICMRAKNGNEI